MKLSVFLAAGAAVLVVAAAFVILDFADNAAVSGADASNPDLVALGKAVYAENCAACHGKNLEGQPNWRSALPSGGLPAPPHDETGHTWHHPDRLLFDYTKLGGAGVLPAEIKSNMPAFKRILTDQEIWAVLAFIKRTWPEEVRKRHQEMSRRAGS